MSAAPRSITTTVLTLLFALAGWGVAMGLGMRLAERARTQVPHPVAPVFTPAPTAQAGPASPEPESVYAVAFREFSSRPEFAGAAIAFCLLDQHGEILFASPLARTALCPASSLKTVTTGAALSILGPEFRFETQVATSAPVNTTGELRGDLVLVGSGDPTLATEDLAELADAVIATGLKSVSGQLVVDASVFPENPVSDHWVWGDLGNAYGTGAFGLNLDHNVVTISFEPGKAGAPAKLREHSAVSRDTTWTNLVTTGPAGSGDQVVVYSQPYARKITMRGTVPEGESGFSVNGSIPDPPALAAEFLRARLEQGGVKFGGQTTAPRTVDVRTIIARHKSAPLPEIIDHLHLVSDNLEAQCLFLTMGRKEKGDPASVIRAHYEKAGVEFAGWRLLDGSGLARANVIRPLDLARVNYVTRHGPYGDRFFESLSLYLNGQVRAKIGSMSGVKTQVGFLRDARGRELTFAAMGNGLASGRDFWRELERMLEAVRGAEGK